MGKRLRLTKKLPPALATLAPGSTARSAAPATSDRYVKEASGRFCEDLGGPSGDFPGEKGGKTRLYRGNRTGIITPNG